jgi:uncharacterized membrane protein YbaN (DUF454 family)
MGCYVALIIVGLFLPTVATARYLLIALALIVRFGLRKRSREPA